MRKIWAIAWKELYTTFTNRNLLLVMIVTPLALSTIMGLAFGGVGGSDSITIVHIPIVVVNLDEGMSLPNIGEESAETLPTGIFSDTDLLAGDGQLVNFGDQLASILAPSAGGGEDSSEEGSSEDDGGFDLPPCRLVEQSDDDDASTFSGSLDDLFATTLLDDVAAARAGVEAGDYVAAITIPAAFSNSLNPFSFGPADESPTADAAPVEIYANHGEPILGGIARSVVESIVSQFVRGSVALGAMGDSVGGRLEPALAGLSAINPDDVPAIGAPLAEWQTFTGSLSGLSPWFAALSNVLTDIGQDDATGNGLENGSENDTGIGAVLTCIFDPNFNTIIVERQPVNELQEQNLLSQIMVQIGSAQAVFFALFTGVFGLLTIYDERRQWTLQRMLASPTPHSSVLFGKVAGNLVVVWMQLALLMIALTLVTSLLTRTPTFIWGDQFGLLFLLTLALTLCVSGIGVLIVGIARTPEQVQVFGPVINMTLGALGGAFGFAVPAAFASLSLITWGVDAFQSLAAGQTDIWLNLAVLAGEGIVFFGVGLWLFRRRVQL